MTTLHEQQAEEKQYWLSKTPHERLQAVETLQQIIATIPLPPDFSAFLQLVNEGEIKDEKILAEVRKVW